jgi:hypothetical protein
MEVLDHERLRQEARQMLDGVETEISAPVVQRRRADQLGNARHRRWLPHHKVRLLAQSGRRQELRPIHSRARP